MTKALSKAEFLELSSRISNKNARKRPCEGRGEAFEQSAVVGWARANETRYPGLWMLHCSLNGVPLSKAQAGKAKSQGMLRGVPDLFLPYPCGKYVGLYIEMKFGRNQATPEQERFLAAVRPLYRTAICWSADEAIAVIREYYACVEP